MADAVRSHTKAAAVEVEQRDFTAALSSLLAAWRELPALQLADAIGALGHFVARADEPLSGNDDEICEHWRQVAVRHRPEDLDRLLTSWLDVPARLVVERVELLSGWPADPRRDVALVRVLEKVPYKTCRKFWVRLLKMIPLVRDPRALPRLQQLDAMYKKQFRSQIGAWVRLKLREALAKLEPALQPIDIERQPEELDDLLAAIHDSVRPSASEEQLDRRDEQLLQRVLDAPEDDVARQVYGDLLSERGHPRGELIALQYFKLTNKLSAEQRKREKLLIRDHLPDLVGPLSDVLYRSGLEFDRGFLSCCCVDDYEKEHLVAQVAGHPLWSTVIDVQAPNEIFEHPVMKSLSTLRVVRDHRDEDLTYLWKGPRVFETVTTLLCSLRSDEEAAGLGNSTLFPALSELQLYSFNTAYVNPSTLLATPLAARLRKLTVELPWSWLPWLEAVQQQRCPIPTVTLNHKQELTLEADERGDHTRLTVRFQLEVAPNRKYVENRAVDKLLEKLAQINPASLSALTLKPSRRFSEQSVRRRLIKALKRFDSVVERDFP